MPQHSHEFTITRHANNSGAAGIEYIQLLAEQLIPSFESSKKATQIAHILKRGSANLTKRNFSKVVHPLPSGASSPIRLSITGLEAVQFASEDQPRLCIMMDQNDPRYKREGHIFRTRVFEHSGTRAPIINPVVRIGKLALADNQHEAIPLIQAELGESIIFKRVHVSGIPVSSAQPNEMPVSRHGIPSDLLASICGPLGAPLRR